MPRAATRENILKCRLRLTDYSTNPLDLQDPVVTSIDVYEALNRHFLFISTHSGVHHLLIEHRGTTCVWNNTIPMRPVYYTSPIRTRYEM